VRSSAAQNLSERRGLARVGWMFQLKAAAFNLISRPSPSPMDGCVRKVPELGR